MSATALLILSAAFHALWNAALKRATDKLGTALSFMIIATLLNALYALLTAAVPQVTLPLVMATLFAGLFEGVYFYLLNTAYTSQLLGVAYTIMRGGAMVLVWGISAVTLKEAIGSTEVLGVLAILAGIVCIQQALRPRAMITSGAYAAYACAACITGYHICYGLAVRMGAAPAFVFAAAMVVGILTYLACSRGSALRQLRVSLWRERSLIICGGAACALSFLLFLTALTVVEPGKAISLRNASVVFGAALSLLTGEHLRPIQWLGVALVTFGVCGFL